MTSKDDAELLIERINKIVSLVNKNHPLTQTYTNNLSSLTKTTYELLLTEENKSNGILPTLYVGEGIDAEQIFRQVCLSNSKRISNLTSLVTEFVSLKQKLLSPHFKNVTPETNGENNAIDSNESDLSEEEIEDDDSINDEDLNIKDLIRDKFSDDNDDDNEDDNNKIEDDNSENEEDTSFPIKNKRYKPSIVDDEHFKLDEMNQFLLAEEKKLENNDNLQDSGDESDEEIDFFEEGSGYEDERPVFFRDFFKKHNQVDSNAKRKFENFDSENEDNDESLAEDALDNDESKTDDDEPKSTRQLIEERTSKKIKLLEDASIADKNWYMKGEVRAGDRPLNSALDEILQFDHMAKPAPELTEKTTLKLEDIIKQRIKDKAFDDVVRKQKPAEVALELKKKLTLNQEKSKESLAQIYEKEYLRQREALNNEEKEEEEPPLFNEIRVMQHQLFRQLDALSNFFFTPTPAVPQLKVINKLPALNMEEAMPVAETEATLLAPEEVKSKMKGDVKAARERTKTDKKRERRKKKVFQREKYKRMANKNKVEKSKTSNKQKQLKKN